MASAMKFKGMNFNNNVMDRLSRFLGEDHYQYPPPPPVMETVTAASDYEVDGVQEADEAGTIASGSETFGNQLVNETNYVTLAFPATGVQEAVTADTNGWANVPYSQQVNQTTYAAPAFPVNGVPETVTAGTMDWVDEAFGPLETNYAAPANQANIFQEAPMAIDPSLGSEPFAYQQVPQTTYATSAFQANMSQEVFPDNNGCLDFYAMPNQAVPQTTYPASAFQGNLYQQVPQADYPFFNVNTMDFPHGPMDLNNTPANMAGQNPEFPRTETVAPANTATGTEQVLETNTDDPANMATESHPAPATNPSARANISPTHLPTLTAAEEAANPFLAIKRGQHRLLDDFITNLIEDCRIKPGEPTRGGDPRWIYRGEEDITCERISWYLVHKFADQGEREQPRRILLERVPRDTFVQLGLGKLLPKIETVAGGVAAAAQMGPVMVAQDWSGQGGDLPLPV